MTLARRAAIVGLLVLLSTAPARAATKVVSFDDLPPDTEVKNQYETSHGVYFQGPDVGDGWFPITRSYSGGQVADLSNCTGGCGEGFVARSIGRLDPWATAVSARVGFLGMGSVSSQVTLTALNPDDDPIDSDSTTVTEGQPFDQTLTVTSSSPNIAAFKIEGETGYAGIAMDDLSITTPDTPPPPDFSLSFNDQPVSVRQGDSVEIPINLNRVQGSNGNITLGTFDLPNGVHASFEPNPVPGTEGKATLRLSADPDATPSPTKYSQIRIRATPTSAGAGSKPREKTLLVRVIENCTREIRLDFIHARTEGCMRSSGPDILISTAQTLRLNGLALEPQDLGGHLIINKKNRTITSDGGEVRVSPADHTSIKLYEGTIDWDLSGGGDGPKQVIDVNRENALVFLYFRVDRVTVSLTKSGKAQVSPTLKLGFWPFNRFGTTSTTTSFTTDNDTGSNFNGLGIKLDRVTALGVELKNVSLSYVSGANFAGGATVVLRFKKPYEIEAGFGLRNGDFDFLRASARGFNTAVGPGIFLQKIGLEVQRSPLRFAGTVGVSAGPSIAGAQLLGVDGTFSAVLDDPFVLELGGVAKLFGADRFKLANAFVRYSSDGLFELAGDLDWDLKVAYANARVSGFVDGLDAAQLEGRARACVAIPWAPDPCAGADLLVSNIGIAACIEIVYAEAGVGYEWGGDFDLFWGSCDLSPWRPAQPSAHTSATRRFTLPRGLPSAAFAVDGVGYAPGVTLTGPGGETISVSRARPRAQVGRLFAIQGQGTTYVVVKRPAAGSWTLTDDNSVPIRRIRQAVGLAKPSASARVSGRGRRRTLHWRLRPIGGQRIKFVEVGRDVRNLIATARSRRGQARFRPADGAAGRRRIVALVEQNGLPRTSIVAGSYRAPGRPRPARPRRARIKRRGTRLVVSWRAPRKGFRHAVYMRLGDGRRLVEIAPARRRSVTVRGVARGYGATARITGLTNANGGGPSARASIKGVAPRPKAGRWKLSTRFDYVKKGRFKVTRGGKAVSALRVTPARAGCGTRELRLKGRRKLARSTRAGLANWIVGRRAPRALDGANPVRVRVTQGSKRLRGRLKLVFDGRRSGVGELLLPGCRLFFESRR